LATVAAGPDAALMLTGWPSPASAAEPTAAATRHSWPRYAHTRAVRGRTSFARRV